jgi:adenylate cyclase
VNFRFRRFQTRIVVFVVGLLTLLSALTFGAVSLAVTRNARAQISTELAVGGRVFTRLITARTQELASATRLLSGDFAFKTAALSDDTATVLSVMENHGARVGADVMQFVSLERKVLADTLHKDAAGTPFVLPDLLARAEQSREASAIVIIDGRPYQMVAVPLLAPLPIAWICVGFIIDDQVARDLQQLTRLQVSFLGTRPDGGHTVLASTLPAPAREPLLHLPSVSGTSGDRTLSLRMPDGEYVALWTPLDKGGGVIAVLQRSLDEALRPYRRLQLTLLALSVIGLIASVGGAVIIARRVTKPVLTVVEGARQVERGDYGQTVSVDLSDEIGELASTFNVMTQGLAERDRVRAELERANRLKGFLSPQVAELIVSSGNEAVLGSHRREITAVFCDLRGFTAFGEQVEPEEVMGFLNAYHDAVGPLVFKYEGTLEQFIGDGVMVFFNDPFPVADHAARAVRLAVDMREHMTGLLDAMQARGYQLGFGVGIAVGFATLGKIGFEGRFDYAAIGSVCNLAARLCAEARNGQILVSQAIATKVEEFMDLETIAPLTLKGFGGPVPAYNVLKAKEPGHAVL